MFLFVSLRPAGELYHQVAVTEFADFVRATGVVDCEHRIIAGISDEVGDVSGFAGVIVGGSSLNVTNDAYDAYQVHVHRQLRLLVDAATPVFFILFRGRLVGGCYRGPGGSVACGAEWGKCGGVIACRIVGSGVWGVAGSVYGVDGAYGVDCRGGTGGDGVGVGADVSGAAFPVGWE